jgi:hypothetical protein
MSILRRRPREVYRVYTEEDYLNGAGSEPEPVDELPVAAEPGCKLVGERRLRRAAGVAMLAGAVGTVGGVVAANSSRAHRGAGRRSESLIARTRSSKVLRSPALTGALAASSSPAVAHPSKATRSGVAPSGRRPGGSDSHPPNYPPNRLRAGRRRGSNTHPPGHVWRGKMPAPQSARVGVQRGGGVATVVDYSAGSSPGGANGVGTSPGPSTAAASSSTTTAGHAEFGFER